MKIHVMHEQASDFEAFMDQHGLDIVFVWDASSTVYARVPGAERFKHGVHGSHWRQIETDVQKSPLVCVRLLAALLSGSTMRSQEHVRDWRYFEAPKLTVSAETLAKVEQVIPLGGSDTMEPSDG